MLSLKTQNSCEAGPNPTTVWWDGFLTLSIFDQQSVSRVCYLFVEERQDTHGAEAEENVQGNENTSQQIRSGVREIDPLPDFGGLILTRSVCPWTLREPFGADLGDRSL